MSETRAIATAAADLDDSLATPNPVAFTEYTLRSSFRKLIEFYGREGARQLATEIIADETQRSAT